MPFEITTKDTCLYRIFSLIPPKKEDKGRLGQHGFMIHLDGDFARRCVAHKINYEEIEKINNRALEYTRRIWDTQGFLYSEPMHFYNKSILLQGVSAPGNACDLYIDGMTRDIQIRENELIIYSYHNVDTITQVYTLLSLWLLWFDVALAAVDEKA